MFAPVEAWMRGVLGWEPNASELNQRAVQLGESGRLVEAIAELDRTIAAAPCFAAAWHNRGSCRAHLGDYEGAIADCSRAIDVDPTFAAAYQGRGIARQCLQRHAEALIDFDRALSLDPTNDDVLLGRAQAAARLVRCEEALADVNCLIARSPNRADAYLQRALILSSTDRMELALDDFEAARRFDPACVEPWAEFGTAHYFCGNASEAVKWLTKSLEHHPDNPLALNNRGVAQFLLGRYREALADIGRAMEISPQFASAKKNLAWLRATCPDAQFRSGREAVELATQALAMIQWEQPEWLEVLAAAHAESGEFDAASEWQEKAINAMGAGDDSAAGRRLRLYHSQQAFRHVCRPGEPAELIPGARPISKIDLAHNINRA